MREAESECELAETHLKAKTEAQTHPPPAERRDAQGPNLQVCLDPLCSSGPGWPWSLVPPCGGAGNCPSGLWPGPTGQESHLPSLFLSPFYLSCLSLPQCDRVIHTH